MLDGYAAAFFLADFGCVLVGGLASGSFVACTSFAANAGALGLPGWVPPKRLSAVQENAFHIVMHIRCARY